LWPVRETILELKFSSKTERNEKKNIRKNIEDNIQRNKTKYLHLACGNPPEVQLIITQLQTYTS